MLRLIGREADICFIPWQDHRFNEMNEMVLVAAEEDGRADEIEFMDGIMGTGEPYRANAYTKIVEDAEESGCDYCNVAFPRNSMVVDIRRFAEEIMPSFM